MVCRARVNEVATIAYATRVAARAELAGTGDGDGACADRRYARVGVGTGEDERAVAALVERAGTGDNSGDRDVAGGGADEASGT